MVAAASGLLSSRLVPTVTFTSPPCDRTAARIHALASARSSCEVGAATVDEIEAALTPFPLDAAPEGSTMTLSTAGGVTCASAPNAGDRSASAKKPSAATHAVTAPSLNLISEVEAERSASRTAPAIEPGGAYVLAMRHTLLFFSLAPVPSLAACTRAATREVSVAASAWIEAGPNPGAGTSHSIQAAEPDAYVLSDSNTSSWHPSGAPVSKVTSTTSASDVTSSDVNSSPPVRSIGSDDASAIDLPTSAPAAARTAQSGSLVWNRLCAADAAALAAADAIAIPPARSRVDLARPHAHACDGVAPA